ncbi:phosphate ABC transporter substrate-binding protein PstS [Floridanema evergladense]|uniref:Phosphate-binding protein n=1 Tax=Floridaenema evergladense BLCC-F167 TaxID=3153639 RepID=A0ABV4WW47_9CYAN
MKRRIHYGVAYFLLACGAIVSVTACNETERPQATVEKNLPFEQRMRVNGAGASFPAPLYQGWFRNLSLKEPRLQFNFQSVGSGAGIERFTTGVVDFAASDIGMTDEQIAKINRGVVLLPMTAGSLVLAYNLPGVKNLKLSRQAYVDIFLGKITKWNDPKIAQSNPGVKLPNQNITVVHRSDGSGTTAVFTRHLGEISPEWKKKVGVGTAVQWPSGAGKTFIAGRGNDGVTGLVGQTPGSIGYIEYSFAKKNNLSMAELQNKAGKFVAPSNKSGSETLAQVELPDNLLAFITDPPGAGSYPIVTYTWMLLYKKYDDPNKAIAMEAMVQYCLTDGQKLSPQLGYIQLPSNVIKKVAAAADRLSPDFQITIPQ